MPKEIKVTCWGSIALSDKYKSYWEDVWLTWKGKPGRKKYYLGPCLCSKTEAESELSVSIECQKKHPNIDWSKDIKISKKSLESINNGEIYIDDVNSKIPNVYSPKELIDRKEAEKMISKLLKIYNIKNVKYDWIKPKVLVTSISV